MDPKNSPERASTDDSLDEERTKADRQLAEKRAVIDAEADSVVRGARKRADAVLQAAREAADHPFEGGGETVQQGLDELFKLERDTTDLHLLTERAPLRRRRQHARHLPGDGLPYLRTMLSGILMTADLLVKEEAPESGSDVRARAERIQRLTRRMSRLVGDLVDVATIETGRPLVVPEEADLQRLLREADDGLHGLATSKQIAFTSETVGKPLPAPFDHERIL